MPSLYAWVNIYANWDPYVNTGNVKIAVASRDYGIDLKDGSYVNSFDNVKKDLEKNDAIGLRRAKKQPRKMAKPIKGTMSVQPKKPWSRLSSSLK